ncbi:MAG: hypothetical protein ACPGWQ_00655 [Poseidonia sp.]
MATAEAGWSNWSGSVRAPATVARPTDEAALSALVREAAQFPREVEAAAEEVPEAPSEPVEEYVEEEPAGDDEDDDDDIDALFA